MRSGAIRVLVVEDEADDAEILNRQLNRANVVPFELSVCRSLAEATAHLTAQAVDVIVLDLSLPDSDGLHTLDAVRGAAASQPVVVLTGRSDDRLALSALGRGAQDYLVKGEMRPHALARSLLYAIERRRLEDERRQQEALLVEAQQIAQVGSFEVDLEGKRASWSNELCRMLGMPSTGERPTLSDLLEFVHAEDRHRVTSAVATAMSEHRPFDLEYRAVRPDGRPLVVHARGRVAADPGKPARVVGTLQDITERKEVETRLTELTLTDPLTGLPNLRALHAKLAELVALGRPFAVIMADVDHFKTVNDRYGHQAGDSVLVQVADKLRHGVRHGDVVARYGGEEFCVLLVDADQRIGAQVAETLRTNVATIMEPARVTASFGVCDSSAVPGSDGRPLIQLADAALYAAKDAGRDRVRVHAADE